MIYKVTMSDGSKYQVKAHTATQAIEYMMKKFKPLYVAKIEKMRFFVKIYDFNAIEEAE